MKTPAKTKIKLSPFVHKVKGAKNYAFYDLFQGRLFILVPEGDVDTLKEKLVAANLAIETTGVIPLKFETKLDEYTKYINLRHLQIRITSQCDLNCPNCGNPCACHKAGQEMPDNVFAGFPKGTGQFGSLLFFVGKKKGGRLSPSSRGI